MDNCALSWSKNHLIGAQSSLLQPKIRRNNSYIQLWRSEAVKELSVTSTLHCEVFKKLFSTRKLCRGECVKATNDISPDGLEDDNEAKDAIQATIKKSQKVLEVQRVLVQRIEERRQLLSTLTSILLDQENASHNGDGSPRAGELTHIEYSNGISPGTYDRSKADEVLQENSPDRNSSSFIGDYDELAGCSETSESYTDTNTELGVPALEEVHPPSYSINTTNLNKEDDLDDLSLSRAADQACLMEEDIKPPPLAGTNVMNVVLVAAECAPWSKTGGLGDVASALPKALARRGHRVMVVSPRYRNYSEAKDTGVRRSYRVDGQVFEVTYFHAYIDGVDFVFVHSNMLQHMGNNIYGGNRVDILKRMVLFCKAAIEVPWHVPCGGACYGDGNLVFIANDWHTSLLPVYLKAYYHDNGLMKYARSVLVIHNIAHQGRGPMQDFSIIDLPDQHRHLFRLYDPLGGEHFNIFAAGLKTAHRVTTVSHGYAWELKTPEGGWGLHSIIHENEWKLKGIVNGIDDKEWNPEFDVYLKSVGYCNYTLETLHAGKPRCKAALQSELGLPVRKEVPLVGFIGRLDHQKGVDLIAEAVPWLVGHDAQLVMLGAGRRDLENLLREFEGRHHDKIRGWVGFSVEMAHRITAGADVLLMPSRFEPCGLNQLYAMRYGTVPVVHAVGGLRDTVQPFDPFGESGLGWTFDRADVGRMTHALGNCFLTYRQYRDSWEGIQKRGMMQDLTWDTAAQKYEDVLIAAKYQW